MRRRILTLNLVAVDDRTLVDFLHGYYVGLSSGEVMDDEAVLLYAFLVDMLYDDMILYSDEDEYKKMSHSLLALDLCGLSLDLFTPIYNDAIESRASIRVSGRGARVSGNKVRVAL